MPDNTEPDNTEPDNAGTAPPGEAAFDDARYPAYTMSTAVDMIGVQPSFLRALGEAGLLTPARSAGGHRRYSRLDLRMAVRARQIVDDGMTLAAACRIVKLEYQLADARDDLASTRGDLDTARTELEGVRSDITRLTSALADSRAELAQERAAGDQRG